MDRIDSQDRIATRLLLETGAFERCEFHEEVYDALAGADDAKDLGRERFRDRAAGYDLFDSEDEVNEAIDRAVQNHGDECSTCAKHRDE